MMLVKFSLLLLITLSGVLSAPFEEVKSTRSGHLGCVKCHEVDKDKINVHLVPHSHDDVGWLKTVDQYFFGMKTSIQHAGVQYIISSVVEALLENPDRRYIQVETAYFWKWWKAQDDHMRQNFKSLVDAGQIEMVNGAWSMNDEACVNYQSTIDQFTWGLRTINETVGVCGLPRIGWQIDPFGHSREQASIFAQLGYDGVFFARLDHDDEAKRHDEGRLNFAWQGSGNLDNSVIFGGIFPTSSYSPPGGYCWDVECRDEPVNDDPESPDYNVKALVDNFANLIKDYVTYYPTKHIIIAMGGDFQYESAETNYINMDRFIKGFKDNKDINLIYSTPSCYIQAVNAEKPQLQLKTDDFFPYSNDIHSFWTGYFTSRPNSKRFERTGHNVLQASKQLIAINGLNGTDYDKHVENIRRLREAMGVLQHHDAITGTEKQHVANDYVRILSQSIDFAEEPLGDIVGELLKINQSETLDTKLELSSCLLSNISICDVSQNSDSFVVAVYNPLSWPVTQHIRLPVSSVNFSIQGPDGNVEYDVVTPISDFEYVNVSKHSPSSQEILFNANLPAMGLNVYFINKTGKAESMEGLKEAIDYSFGDENTGFQIDNKTNLLKSVTLNGVTVAITQNFYYYLSETGDADRTYTPSGAYLFRPNKTSPESLTGSVEAVSSQKGKLVDEFHQKWNDENVNIAQIIRVYKKEQYIEFDWLIGDIDVVNDQRGKEVITKYSVISNFDNKKTFYTDSNGREMIKRTLNYRPDYTYNSSIEPVASNYYPVTSKIVIKDETRDLEVAVLNDRPQGGSSLADGEIELMLHRRILRDDQKGVGECLNETEFGRGVYVRGSHYLVLGSATKLNPDGKTTAAQERILAQKKLVQPWVGLSDVPSDVFKKLQDNISLTYSFLREALPENVNILTFEPWQEDSVLLRLEHIFEQSEDPNLSNITTVDLDKLFDKFTIAEIIETTLGANQLLEDFKKESRYNWDVKGDQLDVVPAVTDKSKMSISLTPMQIRTFFIKLKAKELESDISVLLV